MTNSFSRLASRDNVRGTVNHTVLINDDCHTFKVTPPEVLAAPGVSFATEAQTKSARRKVTNFVNKLFADESDSIGSSELLDDSTNNEVNRLWERFIDFGKASLFKDPRTAASATDSEVKKLIADQKKSIKRWEREGQPVLNANFSQFRKSSPKMKKVIAASMQFEHDMMLVDLKRCDKCHQELHRLYQDTHGLPCAFGPMIICVNNVQGPHGACIY